MNTEAYKGFYIVDTPQGQVLRGGVKVKKPYYQKAEADKILKEVKQIAESLGIKYYLVAGTCLGFVREGGYIETDDDIDIDVFDPEDRVRKKLLENGYVASGIAKH